MNGYKAVALARLSLKRVHINGLEHSGQPAVIGGGDGSQKYHIRVSDLTLDCNGEAIPPGSISRALSLSCTYAKVENVEAKNFGHYQTGAEMFGFGVVSTARGRHHVEIHNCYLHDFISHSDRCAIGPGNPIKVTIELNSRGSILQRHSGSLLGTGWP